MPKKTSKRLVFVLITLLLAVGAVFYTTHALQQPSEGKISSTLSPRAFDYLATPLPKQTEQSVENDCFAISIPVPVSNLKTTSELSGYATRCLIKGSIEQPKAQLTITAQPAPNIVTLSEEPGVAMRLQDNRYKPTALTQLESYQHAVFATDTELTAFWLDEGTLYVVSLYDMARVSKETLLLHGQLVAAVLQSVTAVRQQ